MGFHHVQLNHSSIFGGSWSLNQPLRGSVFVGWKTPSLLAGSAPNVVFFHQSWWNMMQRKGWKNCFVFGNTFQANKNDTKAYLVRCRLYGKLYLSYPSTKNLKNSDLRNHITAAGTAIWVNGGGNDELEEPQAVRFFLVGLFSKFFFKNSRLETLKPHT